MSQYSPETPRDMKPPAITDPDGDTWLWTDSDKRGTPGYQFAGGATMARSSFGVGPAYKREYVEQCKYKVY